MHLLAPQFEGHLAVHNPLAEALGNGGLAHARLADQTGIVLLAAVENLDDPLNLLRPANHRVQLAVLGLLSQGDAVVLQIFPLAGFGLLFLPAIPLAVLLGALLLGNISAGKEAVEEGERGSFALFLRVLLVAARQVLNILHAVHGLEHFAVERIQILIRDAHALHHVVHLGQAQLLGAFQA